MNNVKAEIVKFTSKSDGKIHEAVQFSIMTSQGEWKSGYCFPSSLEFNLVKQALNPVGAIYGSQEDNSL